jgi:hypothetical protein
MANRLSGTMVAFLATAPSSNSARAGPEGQAQQTAGAGARQ